jgi:hypothetical protein
MRDRLLRLSDGAIALEVDGGTAKEVQKTDPFVVASLACLNEILETALDPRSNHPTFFVPQLSEAIPPSRIAQQRPVLNDLADCQSFQKLLCARHCCPSHLDRKMPMRNFRLRTDPKGVNFLRNATTPRIHPRQLTVALHTWVRDNVAYWRVGDIEPCRC